MANVEQPRACVHCGETDTHSRARRLYCYTQRAGVTAKIKRETRRRERREQKARMRDPDRLMW